MDNAAKALVMAASIILGVLLLSAFMYVFKAGASLDENYDAAQNKRQLDLFNSKFEVYDKDDNTIMDLITIANTVYNVNKDYDYDPTMTIELIIQFNSDYFVIPRNEPTEKFSRNQIFKGREDGTVLGEPISIYDLADKTLEELGLGSGEDKLSTAKLGDYTYTADDGSPIEKRNVMIYKYLFKCENMEYNLSNGRVKSLKFTAFTNSHYPG